MTYSEKLVSLAIDRGMTISFAESCTGGGVSFAVTDISGSSAVLKGAVVAYSNEVKEQILGVPRKVLEKYGAVSGRCAAAMARGARKVFVTDYAAAVTGIAGPRGGSALKPVGTVWFSIADKDGAISWKRVFGGNRDDVRQSAVAEILEALTEVISITK